MKYFQPFDAANGGAECSLLSQKMSITGRQGDSCLKLHKDSIHLCLASNLAGINTHVQTQALWSVAGARHWAFMSLEG